jgi:hypothetical protein
LQGYPAAVVDLPGDGETYLASDGRWYRWPDPTPYPSREAAEAKDAWAIVAMPAPPSVAGPLHYGSAPPEPTGIGRATAYLAAVFIGVPVIVAAVAWLLLPHDVEHGCEGIGFGCTLSPADTGLYFLFFSLWVTVPGVGVASLIMLGLTRSWPWYRRLRPVAKAAALVGLLAAPLLLIRVIGLIYYALLG